MDTLQYSDEYVLWLRKGSDTVTVGGISTPDVELYTIINQTSAFDVDPQSGIQGSKSCSIQRNGRNLIEHVIQQAWAPRSAASGKDS